MPQNKKIGSSRHRKDIGDPSRQRREEREREEARRKGIQNVPPYQGRQKEREDQPVAVVTSSTCSLRRLLREKRARILRNTYLPHAGKDRLPRLAIEAGKTTTDMRRIQGVAGQVMTSRRPRPLMHEA